MIKKLEFDSIYNLTVELELVYRTGIKDYINQLNTLYKDLDLVGVDFDNLKDTDDIPDWKFEFIDKFKANYEKKNKFIKYAIILLENKQKVFRLIDDDMNINTMFNACINIIETKQNTNTDSIIQYETLLEASKIIRKYCINHRRYFEE